MFALKLFQILRSCRQLCAIYMTIQLELLLSCAMYSLSIQMHVVIILCSSEFLRNHYLHVLHMKI